MKTPHCEAHSPRPATRAACLMRGVAAWGTAHPDSLPTAGRGARWNGRGHDGYVEGPAQGAESGLRQSKTVPWCTRTWASWGVGVALTAEHAPPTPFVSGRTGRGQDERRQQVPMKRERGDQQHRHCGAEKEQAALGIDGHRSRDHGDRRQEQDEQGPQQSAHPRHHGRRLPLNAAATIALSVSDRRLRKSIPQRVKRLLSWRLVRRRVREER